MVTIDGFQIDATVTEDHTDEVEVTDNPVESGAAVTDHARRKPKTYSMEGIVSDTPIGTMAEARGLTTGNYVLPSEEARTHLQRILDAREPITIETETRTYENMEMLSLGETRSAATGGAFRFRASFKQLILVTNERTTVRVAVPRAAKRVNKGHKKAKPAPASAPNGREVLGGVLGPSESYGRRYNPF